MFSNLVGQTLGKYELRALLGAGGMGAVYRAYDHSLQREVAVKVISLGASNDELRGRFIREARTAAALEHSHIVHINDYGVERDINYIVMQHLTGGALSERMKQASDDGRPRASLPEVALLLEQLASALDYAHTQGVIHRDIKPQNVMFNNQGQAFLVDFGIAKLLTGSTNITGSGTAMGTPSYMSPEQWASKDIGPAADQYALAVMTYQLIAGRLPFEADTPLQVMYKHINEQPTPLSTFRPDAPASVLLVINRALAKDPAERFRNCTQFGQAFASAVIGVPANKTEFFTFKLGASRPAGAPYTPMPNQPVRTPGSSPALSAISLTRQLASKPSCGLIIGAAIVLIAVVIVTVLLFPNRGQSDAEIQLTEVGQTLVAAGLAVEQVETRTAGIEILPTRTPGPTATETPTLEPTITSTLNPRDAALATRNAPIQEVTPTEDYPATIAAELTALYIEEQTATATQWTLTPTQTNTSTNTPTSTDTATASSTPTATFTLSPTLTASFTHTLTATTTASSTPTATFTPSLTLTASFTHTLTATVTSTTSATQTPTSTDTSTLTPTPTATETSSRTPTQTASRTQTFTFTPTETLTPTPTNTLTETSTPLFTETPVPTETSTSRPTSTPTQICRVVPLDAVVPIFVGPGENRAIRGRMREGQQVRVFGQYLDENDLLWWKLYYPDVPQVERNRYWVQQSHVEPLSAACELLPVVAGSQVIIAAPLVPLEQPGTDASAPGAEVAIRNVSFVGGPTGVWGYFDLYVAISVAEKLGSRPYAYANVSGLNHGQPLWGSATRPEAAYANGTWVRKSIFMSCPRGEQTEVTHMEVTVYSSGLTLLQQTIPYPHSCRG